MSASVTNVPRVLFAWGKFNVYGKRLIKNPRTGHKEVMIKVGEDLTADLHLVWCQLQPPSFALDFFSSALNDFQVEQKVSEKYDSRGGGLKHESATPAATANFSFFNPHPSRAKLIPPLRKVQETALGSLTGRKIFTICLKRK